MKQRAGARARELARGTRPGSSVEQMLRAAMDVIVERGYADTRIADVAERTGTSPALVIYYFKTRDQLLTEAIRYSEDTWYAEYLRRLETDPDRGRAADRAHRDELPARRRPGTAQLLAALAGPVGAVAAEPGVAAVREKSDERWREAIRSIVLA